MSDMNHSTTLGRLAQASTSKTPSRTLETVTPLVARAFLALIFIVVGVGKIGGWEGTAGYMASKGMPLVPLFLAGTIAVEVLGGLSLLLGLKARWGALVLAAFLVPVTLVFHGFWALEGMERQVQMVSFMKNVGLMGGLLLVALHGSGRYSVDSWCERRRS